jgi:hypothetical protein
LGVRIEPVHNEIHEIRLSILVSKFRSVESLEYSLDASIDFPEADWVTFRVYFIQYVSENLLKVETWTVNLDCDESLSEINVNVSVELAHVLAEQGQPSLPDLAQDQTESLNPDFSVDAGRLWGDLEFETHEVLWNGKHAILPVKQVVVAWKMLQDTHVVWRVASTTGLGQKCELLS